MHLGTSHLGYGYLSGMHTPTSGSIRDFTYFWDVHPESTWDVHSHQILSEILDAGATAKRSIGWGFRMKVDIEDECSTYFFEVPPYSR